MILLNNNKVNADFFLLTLVIIMPSTLLIGSAVINITIFLIDILFLFILVRNKELQFLNSKTFYLLIIIWFALLINLIFSLNIESSYTRALGFIRFIILVFAIKYILNKELNFKKYIFFSWSILFLIVVVDIFFEYIFGFNTLGFKSYMHGRVASFLNDELKIGNFYNGFILIALSLIYYKFKKINLLLISLLVFIIISLLTGERSNFIKCVLMMIIFISVIKMNIFNIKIGVPIIFLSIIIFILFQNNSIKERYINTTFHSSDKITQNLNINTYLKNSKYVAHYNTAFNMFKNYPIFGVGLKNFRDESRKNIYENSDYFYTSFRQNTHPHQVHLELLAETGLVGYFTFFICFFIFLKESIKNHLKNKNLYQLAGIIFIVISFTPLIPSGSFFTTYGAAIFWINFAVVESFNS